MFTVTPVIKIALNLTTPKMSLFPITYGANKRNQMIKKQSLTTNNQTLIFKSHETKENINKKIQQTA